MNAQFDNKLISSFLLTVDHALLSRGSAYTNASGLLYNTTGLIYSLNTYATPYRQLVMDASITGANIMSGVYVSGVFVSPGQSGLVSLNTEEGLAYFNWRPSSVSGIYAVKDFNVYLSNEPEETLLFETKMELRQKYPYTQSITGLLPCTKTFPVIFIKPLNIENIPFAFGGLDNKTAHIRAIVLGESMFQTVAACNILERLANKNHPLIDVSALPFDALGGITGASYNYLNMSTGTSEYMYINKASTSMLMNVRGLNQLNPSIFPAFVDFEIWNFIIP